MSEKESRKQEMKKFCIESIVKIIEEIISEINQIDDIGMLTMICARAKSNLEILRRMKEGAE